MYTITLDGNIFFDPRIEEYSLYAPTLHREVNSLTTLNFTIYPDHPCYDNITLYSSMLKVYKDDTLWIVMRPITRRRNMLDGIEYECEEYMGIMRDSMYRPDAYGTVNDMLHRVLYMLANLIARHSTQSYTYTNNFDCTSAFDTLISEEDEPFVIDGYKSHYETMMSETVDKWGGYLFTEYTDQDMKLCYLDEDELPVGTQDVRFGENLKDVFIETGGDDFFTRIVPLGKDVSAPSSYKSNGGGSNLPLDITGEPVQVDTDTYISSIDYIPDWEYEKATGVIVEHVERWEKIKSKSALYNKGMEYLNEHKLHFAQNIKLTAVDLHDLDVSVESFDILTRVYAYSEIHGVGAYYLVRKMTINLSSPSESEIEIGTEDPSLTDLVVTDTRASDNEFKLLTSRVFSLEEDSTEVV